MRMVECSGCERLVPAAVRHDCPGPVVSSVRTRATAPGQVDYRLLREALGVPASTSDAGLRAAVAEYVAAGARPAAPPVRVQLAAERAVQEAINAGKFPESRRQHYLDEYARDPAGTVSLIGSLAAFPEFAAGAAQRRAEAASEDRVYDQMYPPPEVPPPNAIYDKMYPPPRPGPNDLGEFAGLFPPVDPRG